MNLLKGRLYFNSGTVHFALNRRLNGTEIAVPAVPELEDNHWFFSYLLYIGGTIHLLMSFVMTISYFLINQSNFVMPRVFNKM